MSAYYERSRRKMIVYGKRLDNVRVEKLVYARASDHANALIVRKQTVFRALAADDKLRAGRSQNGFVTFEAIAQAEIRTLWLH